MCISSTVTVMSFILVLVNKIWFGLLPHKAALIQTLTSQLVGENVINTFIRPPV